jgi:hypothetical protein
MTATISTDCGCGSGGGTATSAASAPASGGERTRYYPRQLVGAADLTQDQLYFREKHRRHNRMLHGWGIVCGAEVRASSKPGCVEINTGYILGPYGDEILIEDIITVDLSAQNLDGDAANGCIPPDPWCADVRVSRPSGQPVYLAISYAEFACRPVQTATSGCGCGCDDTSCEYSRLRDSYRVRVLDTLPETYPPTMQPPPVSTAVSCNTGTWGSGAVGFATAPAGAVAVGQVPAQGPAPCDCPKCAPCPTSPWVILADITVDGTDMSIDCDAHRRYVASFRDFFYVCTSRVRAAGNIAGLFKKAAADRFLAMAAEPAALKAAVLAESARNLDVKVAATSVLGKRLGTLTVGEIAAKSRDAFVAEAASGAPAASKATIADRAGEIWLKASAAQALIESAKPS